jgi:hypothetical protein
MTTPVHRLLPKKVDISIDEFSWTDRIDGVLCAVNFTALDYLELIVNGRVLREGVDYERVLEKGQRGITFLKPSTIKGWAILKVYR